MHRCGLVAPRGTTVASIRRFSGNGLDLVRAACEGSPRDVHLRNRMLRDEHVDVLCTLLRAGATPTLWLKVASRKGHSEFATRRPGSSLWQPPRRSTRILHNLSGSVGCCTGSVTRSLVLIWC